MNGSDAGTDRGSTGADVAMGHWDIELVEVVIHHGLLGSVEDLGGIQNVGIPGIVQVFDQHVAFEVVQGATFRAVDVDVNLHEAQGDGDAPNMAENVDVSTVVQKAAVYVLRDRGLVRGTAGRDAADRTKSTNCTREYH